MARFDPFDELRRKLETAASVRDAISLVDGVVAKVVSWDEARCRAWILALVAWFEDGDEGYEKVRHHLISVRRPEDPEGGPVEVSDVYDRASRLFEVLLARLASLRVVFSSLPMEVGEHIGDESQYGITRDIPRRYLVGWYKAWIDCGFVPGVAEYATQVAEKVTFDETVEIAESIWTADGQAWDYLEPWIKKVLKEAVAIKPELVPTWLCRLREFYDPTPDVEEQARLDSYQRWLDRVPERGREISKEIADHLASPFLDLLLLSGARRAFEAAGTSSVHLPARVVEAVLERDMGVLNPRLPPAVDEAACEMARSVLKAYTRLQRSGDKSALVGCASLTLAIEAQFRWALCRDLAETDQKTIQRFGLAKLAALIEGVVSSLDDLEVIGADKKFKKFMTHAGQIRNRVHHSPDLVAESHWDDLHRAVFSSGPKPGIMSRLLDLRCRRRGD